MSTILTDLLQKSIGRTSRMLMRDHMELVHLQYSRDVEKFVSSSVLRVKQEMRRFFEEDRNIRVLFTDEITDLEQYKNEEEVCIINPVEGITNFAMALPFFAVVMFMKQKGRTSTSACLIDFPALQQTMYASTEEGAWITKSLPHLITQKLKCPKKSQKGNKKEIIVCSDDARDTNAYSAARVLNFGSITYSAFCVFSNSIPACFAKEVDIATTEALTLMTREYGGQTSLKDEKFGIYLPDVQAKQTLTKSYKI
jgi:fructose-1,6-bisphosphatase/inositol monophosphatase family enzyme